MSTGEQPPSNATETPDTRSLSVIGEGVAALLDDPERLALLNTMLGGLGIQLAVTLDPGQEDTSGATSARHMVVNGRGILLGVFADWHAAHRHGHVAAEEYDAAKPIEMYTWAASDLVDPSMPRGTERLTQRIVSRDDCGCLIWKVVTELPPTPGEIHPDPEAFL